MEYTETILVIDPWGVLKKLMHHVGIKMNNNCTYGVQKIKKRRTLHHVVGCALNLLLRIDFPLTFIVRFKSLVYRKRLELPLKNWFSDLVPAIVLSSKSSKLTPACSLIVCYKFLFNIHYFAIQSTTMRVSK